MADRTIKDFYGKIIGSLSEDSRGNIVAKNFYGKILGHYDKNQNVTKDFYGRILSTGDTTSALIWQWYNEHLTEVNNKKENK